MSKQKAKWRKVQSGNDLHVLEVVTSAADGTPITILRAHARVASWDLQTANGNVLARGAGASLAECQQRAAIALGHVASEVLAAVT